MAFTPEQQAVTWTPYGNLGNNRLSVMQALGMLPQTNPQYDASAVIPEANRQAAVDYANETYPGIDGGIGMMLAKAIISAVAGGQLNVALGGESLMGGGPIFGGEAALTPSIAPAGADFLGAGPFEGVDFLAEGAGAAGSVAATPEGAAPKSTTGSFSTDIPMQPGASPLAVPMESAGDEFLNAMSEMVPGSIPESGGGFMDTIKSFTEGLPSLDKLTTGSKLADSVIASGVTSALSGGGGDDTLQQLADQQRADQVALDTRLADGTSRINSAFSGFNDGYYSNIAQAYRDHYGKLIDEQAAQARRKVQLNWPGGPGTSGYARRMGDLTRDVERQYADTASQSVDFSNQQRQQVESNRSNLIAQLQGGANADSLASQATSQAAALATPPAYSPIADLFSRYTSIPANMVLARNNYGTYGSGGSAPTRFSGKSPISMVS